MNQKCLLLFSLIVPFLSEFLSFLLFPFLLFCPPSITRLHRYLFLFVFLLWFQLVLLFSSVSLTIAFRVMTNGRESRRTDNSEKSL